MRQCRRRILKSAKMANYGVFFRPLYYSCILLQASTAAFVEHIVSEVVITGTVGQRIVLPCTPTVNRSVRWLYQPSESSEADEIFFNGLLMNGNRQHFEVPSAGSGNYALVVKQSSLANSGIYTCWEENGQGDQHIVHLAVMRMPEVVPMKSSSTLTTSTVTPEYAITDSSGGPSSKTATSTVAIVTVIVVLLLVVVIATAVVALFLRRNIIGLCRKSIPPGSSSSQHDGLGDTPLLGGSTWDQISEFEHTVYSSREQNPKEWTNNRFVVGVARNPEFFSTFLRHLKADVQRNRIAALVGINSSDCRGELIAAPLAYNLGIPYVSVSMIATSTEQKDFETETFMSTNGEYVTLEVAKDDGLVGKKVVIIDSFYLTGRSLKAAKKLVKRTLRVKVVETIVFTAVGVPTSNKIKAIFKHHEQMV